MATLKRSVFTISLVLAVLSCLTPPARSGTLREVWEVDLRKLVPATNGIRQFPVFALRFSPDGRKLAVIADIYQAQEGRRSRLLVSDIDPPPARFREFSVQFGILEDGGSALNFGWARAGEIIYALGKVIHLADGTTCDLPNQSVFVNDDVAISARGVPASGIINSTHITFYNQNCEVRGQWNVPEGWLISDVSADRAMLSILKEGINIGEAEGLVVDPMARKVVRRWSWKEFPGGAWRFANSGKALCHGGSGLNVNRSPALCRDVDNGKEIGETLRNGEEPIATSSRGTRVVVSDYRRTKIPFDYEYKTTFKGRYVWDFGTGQELASWYPGSQTYPNVLAPPKQITEPFRFAMSPDGQYIAEGGDGIIRLYKIGP
jgi:hypothetical protein